MEQAGVRARCVPVCRAPRGRGASRMLRGALPADARFTRGAVRNLQAVEELVQERDDLHRASTALEKVIDEQKQVCAAYSLARWVRVTHRRDECGNTELGALAQVLQELEQQVDAAQRRAAESMEEAQLRMDEVSSLSLSRPVPRRRCCAAGGTDESNNPAATCRSAQRMWS